jgi:hypothetical protein
MRVKFALSGALFLLLGSYGIGQEIGPACLRWPAAQSGRAAQPGPEYCARAHRSLALLFARWSELLGVR